ncbi:serine/threonine-protein phosphatase 4 regulatory subunit 3-like [Lineus longissimus]|uniref:serine/threonine-protein phosphatase 4 regulatory subunit 3-like n=1 Tax=Lineus longissimus TaxID=88925 RepID=UPI002B4EBFB7
MDDTNTRRRVKLYMLNEERQWDDRGTGHVSWAYVERFKGMSLLVISETDGCLLLESKIQPDTAYQKQQETLIVWSEADNYDLALSFQEKAGCDEIWEKICQVQGKDPSVEVTQDLVEESEDERYEEVMDSAPPIELPPCELSRLEEISELFNNVITQSNLNRREKLAMAIENEAYLNKLLDLFHICEDLENQEGLHHMYDIFKSTFLLNKNALFEIMFSDELIFDVIGVLEYDPSLPQPAKHRDYLRNTAKFKEVIPISNKKLLNKIHQTFRVQYIQDVILPTPSVFEENMLSTLGSFIFFRKVEIVTMIQDDEKFLQTIFAQLTDDETDDSKRRDMVLFLKEFCTFSQTLQQNNRDSFFGTLSNLGILSAIEVILGLDDDVMKEAAIAIFSFIIEISPSMVREFILNEGQTQDDDDLLINLVIEQIITDSELGCAVQLISIIKILIDPENMLPNSANKTEKTEFLSFFYKHSMHVLTAPLFANTADDKPSRDDYQTAQLLGIILELLSFCVEHHTYHIRNYIFNKDLLRRVLVLLKSKHAFLALSALRFMRKIIGLKDDFHNRYIIKGDLFLPVVEAFKANGKKYNLLNSAMIEMFEYIKVEDIKVLCAHIVENHLNAFDGVDYVPTFKALKMRYEQQQDRMKDKPVLDSVPSILRNNRFRRDARTLEEEEEMWFDQEDELEDGETIVPVADMLKGSKLDSDLDQINRLIENRKVKENVDLNESPPKLHNKMSPINITLKNSPVNAMPVVSQQKLFSVNSGTINASPKDENNVTIPVSSSPTTQSQKNFVTSGTNNTSPKEEAKLNSVATSRKPGMVGLVDYPDEDSDDDEEDEDGVLPAAKRPRLST